MLAKFQTNFKCLWSRWRLLILVLLTISSLSLPIGAFAQNPSLKFDTLSVALWPEFDRPETLVIYRAQLDADTTLPAELSFKLPVHIDSMHAIAYEQNGSLMNVDPNSITISQDGDDLWLTFSTPSPKIQFEYYDPILLTKQDENRTLDYQFSTLYPIETATFEVQQPAQSERFFLTPEADDTYIGSDGWQYSNVQVANLAADETYSLSASYQSNSADVLLPDLASQPLEQPEDLTFLSNSIGNGNTNYLGYSLIGAGVVLFAGVAGYWWFKQTKANIDPRSLPSKHKRRPVRRKKKQISKRKAINQTTTSTPIEETISQPASFCYRCGVALREDSNFCHNCGAERR